jgi:glutamyl-tRNA(Gln) amidotransferase subunit E
VREVFARAQEALEGVPAETRQSFFDGTTGFERILPGPNRMYPDTDTPPVPVPDSWVEEIRATLPERPWEREARYEKLGLDLAVARRLVDAEWSDLFDAVAPEAGECARRVAFALEKRLPCFRRRTRVAALPGEERLAPLVRALERGELRLDGFELALDRLLEEPAAEVAGILHAFRPCGAGDPELAAALRRTLEAAAQLPGRSPEVLLRWSVGQVMGALRGRVDPGQVRRALRRELDLLGSRRAVGEPRP